MRRVACGLLLVLGCGGSPAATGADPGLSRPATDASGRDPALASAGAAYARLLAAPVSVQAAAPDAQAGVAELLAHIQRASGIVEEIVRACRPLEATPSPSRVPALLLHADALDHLASHTAAATMPMPLDMAARMRQATPDVRVEIERLFHEQIGEAMATQARSISCMAVRQYQRVLEVDPSNPRATQQLAAYGELLVRSCP